MSETTHIPRDDFLLSLPQALALSLWIRWLSRKVSGKDIKIFLACMLLVFCPGQKGSQTAPSLSRVGSFQEFKLSVGGRSKQLLWGPLKLQLFS